MKTMRSRRRTAYWILFFSGVVFSVLPANVSRSSGWSISTIDNVGDVGSHSSIAIDSNDKVHISYLDQTDGGDLKYVTNTSGSWVISTIDTVGDSGYFTSIAVDASDKVHISYSDILNGGLKYATNASGLWETFLIADGDTALFTSIAVDSNNSIHISYFENGHTNLKYATNASGTWETFTIDGEGFVGRWTSISIDSNDYVHISYYDDTNGNLKYATNASGSWETFTIDSAGEPTSLAVDSGNKVHISYRDTNGALKYATNISNSWETFTIDNTGYYGYYSSIAIDSNDKVHIGYLDNGNADLKYATNASGSWLISTIDGLIVGAFPSIAIDSRNKIHISYHDGANGDLRYATDATPAIAVPYDDFSGTYISKEKWKQGVFVREVDVVNHRLLSKLGSPSPSVIETYPYKSMNDLVFFDPESIHSIQADVSVLEKNVASIGTVKALVGGRWYHYYTTESDQGYVWGEIAIRWESTGLKATWSVLKSSDPYFSVWEPLGTGDFTTTISIGATYTLYMGYDADANQFMFKVGAEELTFGPTGLPDRDRIGFVWKSLLTEAEVADTTSAAYISATFANVYVNDSLYEDFSSVFLDPTKWSSSYSSIDGEFYAYDEFVREISGGSFRSKIRTQSLSRPDLSSRLEFLSPSSIRLIRTRVTPLQYQNEDNQGARVEARIAGHFYNEGTSNIGYAGEVEAKIWIGGNWNGGGAIPAARWWVKKFIDYAGTFSQILDQGTFTIPIALRATYVLSIGMNANQLSLTIEDSATGAFEEVNYVPATGMNTPNIPWKEIGTLIYNTGPVETTIEVLFDDVIVDPPRHVVDFSGDRKTDITTYRSCTGTWYVYPSGGGTPYGVGWGGDPTDRPTPGDYDGDGMTDVAVYRASDGGWYIIPSRGGAPYGVGWGIFTDKPVPGDYDGDGKTDLAIYRDGLWFVSPSGGGSAYALGWGIATDKPVPGDYDGDGKTDLAVYRDGIWFIYPSGGGTPYGLTWGIAGDLPVPGDYDGDGKTDIAVHRPGTGVWYIIPSGGGSPYAVGWGGDASDIPVTSNPGAYM